MGWGGARPGAGRKPKGKTAGVSHGPRPKIEPGKRYRLSMTLREEMRGALETPDGREILAAAIEWSRIRDGFTLHEASAGGQRFEMVVTADDLGALSSGVQAVSVRLALNINRLLGRSGKLFTDRYRID